MIGYREGGGSRDQRDGILPKQRRKGLGVGGREKERRWEGKKLENGVNRWRLETTILKLRKLRQLGSVRT